MEKITRKKWGSVSVDDQTRAKRLNRFHINHSSDSLDKKSIWIETVSGNNIIIYDTDVKASNDETKNHIIIGGIIRGFENERYIEPHSWDYISGESLINPGDEDLMVWEKIVENYDDITEKDVPDTPEFQKDYDDYCKYANKMSKVEYLRFKKFCSDHKHKDIERGAIGGGTVVSFMGTGLGNCVKVKCEFCGSEIDITDSASW